MQVSSATARTDRDALVALYRATSGADWLNSENWDEKVDLAMWHGVRVDDTDGRVVSLSLPSNNLQGSIPPELGSLSALRTLELGDNQLSGSIPPEMGALTALETLNLWRNLLSERIPEELGRLRKLRALFLHENKLIGPIPQELGKLVALTTLVLARNQLSGDVPKELGSLSNLQNLCLHNNQLTGSIPPEVGKLRALQNLTLAENQLIDAHNKDWSGPRLALLKEKLRGAVRKEPWAISLVEFVISLWHFVVPILDDYTDLLLLIATFEDRGGLWWACFASFMLAEIERILILLVTLLLILCWIPFALIGNNVTRGDVFRPLLTFLNGGCQLRLEAYEADDGRWGPPRYALRWPVWDGFLWGAVGSRSKSSALMALWGMAGNTPVEELEQSGFGLSLIDRIVYSHPYSVLGRFILYFPYGHHLPSSSMATRRSAVMLRAVGETLVVDPLFLALSLTSDIWDDGVSIGISSLVFSVLELLTELQYYASETRGGMIAAGEELPDAGDGRHRVEVVLHPSGDSVCSSPEGGIGHAF
ncbi:unnamed protein product [Scytosiphon promiscuus]